MVEYNGHVGTHLDVAYATIMYCTCTGTSWIVSLPPSKSVLYIMNYLFPTQKSFSASLVAPDFLISDFAKFDRPGQLHLAFQALDSFRASEGRYPLPYNKEDAVKFVELAKTINDSAENKVRVFVSGTCVCFSKML